MGDRGRRHFHSALHILNIGALFLLGGILIHTLVMFVDYHLITESLHLKLHEDFVGNVFSAPMIPMIATYGILSILSYLSWQRAKKASLLAHERAVENEKMDLAVKFMQRLTGILAEHITMQNVQIINWTETRRKLGHPVPEKVEMPTKNMAKALQSLSAISFVFPYTEDPPKDLEEIERILRNELDEAAGFQETPCSDETPT